MTQGEIATGLEVIRTTFGRVLSDGGRILEEAKRMVQGTKEEYDERVRQRRPDLAPEPWGYDIGLERPLEFKDAVVDGLRFRVDIAANVRWCVEGALPVKHDLAIRVWALDDHVCFRKDLDALTLESLADIQRGRVMLRFHLDRKNVGQSGPNHHVQVGGNAREDEHCWLHPSIKVPRLPFPPMDLVLACELVVANFFPDDFGKISLESAWCGALRASQKGLLEPYYKLTYDTLRAHHPGSLLRALCC